MSKNFKNSIIITLILGFILPYISFTPKVEAQGGGFGAQGGYGGGSLTPNLPGLVGYASALAPVLAQLPLCLGKTKKSENLFNLDDEKAYGAYLALRAKSGNTNKTLTRAQFLAKDKEELDQANAVPTFDSSANSKLNEQAKELDKIKKSTQSLDENDSCWKSVGQVIAGLLVQKITQSTVAWIQNNYQGEPSFVQNPKEFFEDIAKTELLQFGLEINDPNLFPYGKSFLRNQALALNRRFTENSRYSLNEMIQETTPEYSAASFLNDFSNGGWNGWVSFTQVDGNNPIGFEIRAGEEITRRIEEGQNSVERELNHSDGFLSDTRCSDPVGLKKSEHREALIKGDKDSQGNVIGTCKRWEYVTPGQVIAESATTAVAYPVNSLLRIEDLNSAVAALLDAVISQFSNKLVQDGFANLPTQGADGGYIINNANYGYNHLDTQAQNDYGNNLSTWLEQNSNFNLRTDLTQALIDQQRTYVAKLEEQNEVLMDLATTARQADYCELGPHFGWELDSRRILSAVENTIVSKTPADMEGVDLTQIKGFVNAGAAIAGAAIASAIVGSAATGAAIGSVVPGLGTVIGLAIGAIVGLFLDLFAGQNNEEMLSTYYRGVVQANTGLHLGTTANTEQRLANKHEVTNGLDKIFDKYVDLIHEYYPPEFLTPAAKAIELEFRKIPGYIQTEANNEYTISTLNGIITRLGHLKKDIEELNFNYLSGGIADENGDGSAENEYEEAFAPFLSEFNRLSTEMVSGDDIAVVDNSLKQSRSQIKYVYEDLITGPYGCEKHLETRQLPTDPTDKTGLLLQTARAEYPFKIWYDYNDYGASAPLPLPQNIDGLSEYTDKTESNRMPSYPIGEVYGPGFLSSVYFDSSNHIGGEGTANNHCNLNDLKEWQLDCLTVAYSGWTAELFDGTGLFGDNFDGLADQIDGIWQVAPCDVSLGRRQGLSAGVCKAEEGYGNQQEISSWEQTIYVY